MKEMRIVVNKTGVEKVQILTSDRAAQKELLDMYNRLDPEIRRFSEIVRKCLSPKEMKNNATD